MTNWADELVYGRCERCPVGSERLARYRAEVEEVEGCSVTYHLCKKHLKELVSNKEVNDVERV